MTKDIIPLNVLIAEDSEDDLILLMRELRRGGFEMSFKRVDNEPDLMGSLSAGDWDLVITDYKMPKLSGLDVVKAVREAGLEVPVIIVSGLMGEDFAVTAMKAGADDYILKDRLSRLAPAIGRELREYKTMRAHRKAEQEILFLNRLLETVLEVDKMVVREPRGDRVLSETCRILVEKAGFMMAWIGKADLSTGVVTPVCHAGCRDGFFEGISVRFDDAAASGMGPTGIAVRTGRHVVCQDTESDESFASGREEARACGFRACASFPVLAGGTVFGNMNVYSSSTGFFAEKTIDLLESLAADIGFALKSFEQAFERKKAESALRDSEERLRTIFDSALDGMFVIDHEGRYLDVNLAGCRMFGYTKEELLSSGVRLLVPPEGLDKIDEHHKAWKTGGYLPEVRMLRKDGSEIWVDMAITPLRVGEKELALGIKRDITARKIAEEALRESEERFRQIFEQNQDAQVILDRGECRVIDANPAAVELFGYSREELTAIEDAHFLGEEVCEKIRDGASRGAFSLERVDAVRADGTKAAVSLRAQVITLRQSAMVLCTVKDMTEFLRMEEEARYIQSKLIHANKMTSIGTLASGVAHEINNPNNFILFNSTLLSDAWKDAARILERYYRDNGDFSLGGLPYSEMSEVVPELLSGITDGSRRIKGIVDNLKDFSRKDKAGLEGRFDANRAVKASVSILNNQILKYTDSFDVDCAEGLPKVKGSAQKIEQVIINLVLNALHALPDRKKKVKVSTRHEEGKVIIEVMDEGAGMTKEVLERVMEPFFTTKADHGGTGLGLSISYSIVKEHGGALEFASAPGTGTTARISLPAEEGAE